MTYDVNKKYWVYYPTQTGRNHYHGDQGCWEDETANALLLALTAAVKLAKKHKACVCGIDKRMLYSFHNCPNDK